MTELLFLLVVLIPVIIFIIAWPWIREQGTGET